MRLNDRTAIVTGASMGIGAATAISLAKRGVTVWAVARNRERLEMVAGQHARIQPIVADITDEDERSNLIETTGPVDILVNNAGIGTMGLIETMPFEDVRQIFELNVLSLIDLTQRVLPKMIERGDGHICNVGSSISHVASPPLSVYAASKFAVEGFTDGLRREVSARGVGVSLIQPGPVKTGFWERAREGDSLEVADNGGAGIPAQWVAKAIVKAIRFDKVPGYATVGVPRAVGFGRVLDLPLVSYLFDLGASRRMAPSVNYQGTLDPDSGTPVSEAEVIPLHPDDKGD